jgi:hypothetical protein
VVVRGGADAAGAEDHVARGQGALQGGGDALGIVAEVLGPGQLQSALAEQLQDLGEMLVDAAAREDLVADDDESECHESVCPKG